MWHYVSLSDRSFIALSGPDRLAFLQGLITQDVYKLSPQTPLLYSALLTPQGKYLYDFFLGHEDDRVLIETDAQRRDEFIALLRRYVLRKNIAIDSYDASVWQIFGGEGDLPIAPELTPDPRLAALGYRVHVHPSAYGAVETDINTWTAHRLRYDVPDCPYDLRIGLSTPFEGNIDLLNGIDFTKGCYLGQEMVSRIHHRGLVKKRFHLPPTTA